MAVVGVAGFLAFFVLLSASGELKPGEDAVEPIALIIVPVLANVCYTAGWMMELAARATGIRSPRTGPGLFAAGLAFSCVVAWLPALFWAGILIWHLVIP